MLHLAVESLLPGPPAGTPPVQVCAGALVRKVQLVVQLEALDPEKDRRPLTTAHTVRRDCCPRRGRMLSRVREHSGCSEDHQQLPGWVHSLLHTNSSSVPNPRRPPLGTMHVFARAESVPPPAPPGERTHSPPQEGQRVSSAGGLLASDFPPPHPAWEDRMHPTSCVSRLLAAWWNSVPVPPALLFDHPASPAQSRPQLWKPTSKLAVYMQNTHNAHPSHPCFLSTSCTPGTVWVWAAW